MASLQLLHTIHKYHLSLKPASNSLPCFLFVFQVFRKFGSSKPRLLFVALPAQRSSSGRVAFGGRLWTRRSCPRNAMVSSLAVAATLVACCFVFYPIATVNGNAATVTEGSCSSQNCEAESFTYLVGSGWHASVSGVHPLSKINSRVDATVRTPSWFPLWYEHLIRFTGSFIGYKQTHIKTRSCLV